VFAGTDGGVNYCFNARGLARCEGGEGLIEERLVLVVVENQVFSDLRCLNGQTVVTEIVEHSVLLCNKSAGTSVHWFQVQFGKFLNVRRNVNWLVELFVFHHQGAE
jgi:hypothetical protein